MSDLRAWEWLHQNEFSWDDVNAIAAILEHGGFDVVEQPHRDFAARLRAAEIIVDVVVLLREAEKAEPGSRNGYLLGVLFARLDAYEAAGRVAAL